MLYFDHAASTPMCAQAYTILCDSYKYDFANPASKHKLGSSLAKKIDISRKEILDSLCLSNFNIIYTSSATESNNQVIKSFQSLGKILFLNSDHPSVTNALGINDIGIEDHENILDHICEEVSLVVLTVVNSQSGKILDISNLSNQIKNINPKVKILLDASQAIGKIIVDYKNVNFDFLTIASHKLGGPRGIAGLVYKDKENLISLFQGGGHEDGLRSSTPATSLILAFAKALTLAVAQTIENHSNVYNIKEYIVREMKGAHANISFPFEEDNCSPYIVTLLFKGISSDILLRYLEMKEIYVSSSTACSSKIKGFNPMFKAIGIDEAFHKNILRISFGSQTTQAEAIEFVKNFKEIINEIKFLIK